MKRSAINDILKSANDFIADFRFALPPFAHLSPDALRTSDNTCIRERRLGWDITDYGGGDFAQMGLALFTLRNGTLAELQQGRGMVYAEKLLISRVNQLSPMHTHALKSEDIINRGGGTLVVELFASAADGRRDPSAPVTVFCDGTARTLPAGGKLKLAPGESVTLMPGDWHAFWAEGADCLIGEVSTVNDDETDNIFDPPLPRFTTIDEDEAPWRLLVSDYPRLLA
ncbi:D-lyxose/D-mannose family sugar isomerase [Roseinatronobacter alkalisoli]|uniref:D-lyxose ketol-isomerase n=1 Tax=Roseinatronobacter alkalisoli TaxID=3028235 RepID=A0ABT5T3B1_9RHOB|nr:D-lyxose/D-mannose family sugar isomerase [Roseinatronobacter sp. HJB301]MDD7969596.1 D-lyxose/D-mannose family sugar isomerase [Roseinatronobacter sp. HJB301]